MLTSELRTAFSRIVGQQNAWADPSTRLLYAKDASPYPGRTPDLVLRPGHVDELVQIIRLANDHGVPIYPRSGVNLWGGAIPLHGGIVLDMKRMNRILSVDPELFSVTVETGATLWEIHQALTAQGYYNRVAPEGALASAIGGSFLCHGDGIGSALWGNQGDAVIGCKMVLPNGDVVVTGSAANPAAVTATGTSGQFFRYGYANDLTGLFCGSEGTLGVLAELTLSIEQLPEKYGFGTYNFNSVDDACAVLYEARRRRVPANFATLREGRSLAAISPGVEHPVAQLVYVLEGDAPVVDHYMDVLEQIVKQHGGTNAGPQAAERFWERRFGLTPGAMFKLGARVLLPLHYPLGQLAKFYHRIQAICAEIIDRRYGLPYFIGGFQIGAAFVIYPTIMYLEQYPEQYQRVMACTAEVKEALLDLGGAPISLGRLWAEAMPRLGPHYELLKQIKQTTDPKNIMNPGILFPVAEVGATWAQAAPSQSV